MKKIKRLSEREKVVYVSLMEAINGDRRAQRAVRDCALGYSNLSEAITTSDFPGLFQKAINAQAEAQYTVVPSIWQNWAKRYEMKGLRKENFVDMMALFDNLPDEWSGAATYPGGLPRIAEGTPYPAFAFTGGEKDVWTYKVGGRFPFTWEAWENDDWNLIAGIPDAMVQRAKRQEDLAATAILVGSSGPLTSSGAAFQYGALSGNPALSYTALSTAIAQGKANPSSNPDRVNVITKFALIVPPSLENTARDILATTRIEWTDAGGNKLETNNTIGTQVELVVNPFLDSFFGSYANKTTTWMLAPFAGQGSDRTAIVETFVRGRTEPELRIKNDQGNALGGGALDPYEGSFDADDIQIRVRHFTNAVVVNNELGFVFSTGAGA